VLVEKARQIEVQAQFSYWDALIVAAALLSGCDTLYTEDLQDGRVCFIVAIVAIVAILVVAGSSHVVHPRSPARRQL
jgi:predicted nucleic acid-binding protein